MNHLLTNFLTFAAGAAVGSVVAWKLLKTKYEIIAQEEIDSVKAVFTVRKPDSAAEESTDENNIVDEESVSLISDYKDLLINQGYIEQKEVINLINRPQVIDPDEFAENDRDYDVISLDYYADGILVDDMGDAMDKDEIERTVGLDSLSHFGEYEDDSVFVRNDDLKTLYEILLDTRNYSDVVKPNRTEE